MGRLSGLCLLRPRRYHLLSHFDITAEDGTTDNNELLTVDQLVIKSLNELL
jgi:hypothetical protein